MEKESVSTPSTGLSLLVVAVTSAIASLFYWYNRPVSPPCEKPVTVHSLCVHQYDSLTSYWGANETTRSFKERYKPSWIARVRNHHMPLMIEFFRTMLNIPSIDLDRCASTDPRVDALVLDWSSGHVSSSYNDALPDSFKRRLRPTITSTYARIRGKRFRFRHLDVSRGSLCTADDLRTIYNMVKHNQRCKSVDISFNRWQEEDVPELIPDVIRLLRLPHVKYVVVVGTVFAFKQSVQLYDMIKHEEFFTTLIFLPKAWVKTKTWQSPLLKDSKGAVQRATESHNSFYRIPFGTVNRDFRIAPRP